MVDELKEDESIKINVSMCRRKKNKFYNHVKVFEDEYPVIFLLDHYDIQKFSDGNTCKNVDVTISFWKSMIEHGIG